MATTGADFTIQQNDGLPQISATLTDAANNPVDLSGATVNFYMRRANHYPFNYKVNAAASVVTPATNANVAYYWQSGDTDTPGLYEGRFVATYSSGKIISFPNDGWMVIEIVASSEAPVTNIIYDSFTFIPGTIEGRLPEYGPAGSIWHSFPSFANNPPYPVTIDDYRGVAVVSNQYLNTVYGNGGAVIDTYKTDGKITLTTSNGHVNLYGRLLTGVYNGFTYYAGVNLNIAASYAQLCYYYYNSDTPVIDNVDINITPAPNDTYSLLIRDNTAVAYRNGVQIATTNLTGPVSQARSTIWGFQGFDYNMTFDNFYFTSR